MEFVLAKENSSLLEDIIQLGDKNRSTLGFLPRQAYEDYAKKRHIIALIDNSHLLAYLLYRTTSSLMIIVHLCVAEEHRSNSHAKTLVDYLIDHAGENITAAQLACRRDYDLAGFWQSLGFHPISERPGRATREETTLTIWIRPNPNCNNLFTEQEKYASKIPVLLDTNIVIDLFDQSSDETNALSVDFLANYAQFFVSRYVSVELNKNTNAQLRQEHLQFVHERFETAEVDIDRFNTVQNDILKMHPAKPYDNTWYDICNIATAITFGSSYFITRDAAWLNTDISKCIHDKYGLSIMSPGEFFLHIDELDSPDDYAPLKLYGLGLQWKKLSVADYSDVVYKFYSFYGKKHAFENFLRHSMTCSETDVYIAILNNSFAALCCIEYSDGKAVVSSLYVASIDERSAIYPTFVRWISAKLFEEAQHKHMKVLEISAKTLPKHIVDVLSRSDLYLNSNDGSFFRVILPQIVSKDAFEKSFILPNPHLSRSLSSSNEQFAWNSLLEYKIERMLSPMKLTPSALPIYIVPINGSYAQELFDEALAEDNPCFFENQNMLATLSDEKVYFKKAKNKIIRFPARIMWYVSQSSLMGTKQIRACSILDDVTTGPIETVYKKYHRLGIIDWNNLKSIAGDADELTAYSFSRTELLENPISLEDTRRILDRPNETFPSFREINESQFLELYKQGTNCKTP